MKEAKAIKVVRVCVCVLRERGKDESNWRLPWNAVQLHIPHNPCDRRATLLCSLSDHPPAAFSRRSLRKDSHVCALKQTHKCTLKVLIYVHLAANY